MRLGLDAQAGYAATLLATLAPVIGDDLVASAARRPQDTEPEIAAQRERVEQLRERLDGVDGREHARTPASCWPLSTTS